MIRRDLGEVTQMSGLSRETLFDLMRRYGTVGLVVEEQEKLRGFMVYGMKPYKLGVLYFVVEPAYRQQMLSKILSRRSDQRGLITVDMSTVNQESQRFLEQEGGFKLVDGVLQYGELTEEGRKLLQAEQEAELARLAQEEAKRKEALCWVVLSVLADVGVEFEGEAPPTGTTIELNVSVPGSNTRRARFEFGKSEEWEVLPE